MSDAAVEVAQPQEQMTPRDARSMIGNALARQNGAAADPIPEDETTPEELIDGPDEGEGDEETPPSRDGNDADLDDEPEPVEAQEESEDEDDSEAVEIPETIDGLAEYLGVDPSELAGHLRHTFTDEDGKQHTVTFQELAQGNLRQADYSRKTEALAEERRAFDAERGQAQQALKASQQSVDMLITSLQAELQGGPTDQEILEMMNPNSPNYIGEYEAQRIKVDRDQKRIKFQTAITERQRAIEAAQHAQQVKQAEWRNEQIRLAQNVVFPNLDTPEKQMALESDIRNLLTKDMHPTLRYTEAEADQFFQNFDARQLPILNLALKQVAAEKAGKKLMKTHKTAPRALKPNAPKRASNNVSEKQRSLETLRKTGSKDAAMSYIRGITRSQR